MEIIVTGRHLEITEPVKVYAQQKVTHVIDKFMPERITKVHIIMDVQKYNQIVEMEIHGPKINIYGKATSTDMYTSIDKVIDKIERQFMKVKTKFNKRKHVRASSIRVSEPIEPVEEELEEE